MKLCPNQHTNEDDALFCETCGSRIEADATPADASSDDDQVVDVDVIADDDDTQAADDVDTDVDSSADDDSGDDDSTADDQDDDDDLLDPLILNAADLDDDDDDDQGPTVPAVVPPIASVISELQEWARDNQVEDDPYIVGLSEAVAQRNDLGMWASIDPLQTLPEPREPDSQVARLVQWLTVVRNVLVFVPVAITWMAISKATTAYKAWDPRETSEQLANGESLRVEKNFLDFWSKGYGKLAKHWTIPEVGKTDFYIIAIIIVLALVISYLGNRSDSVRAKLVRSAEAQRTAIGIKIRRSLHGKREASPDSIAESLADALADLNQTTRDMAEVAARLERSSVGVEALAPQLETLNSSAATFATQTSQMIATAVNALVSSVDNLNSSVNQNLTTVFESAVANLQEAGEQLARTSASVEYGTKLLKDDIESIRKGLRR
jgi:hypothetical protein